VRRMFTPHEIRTHIARIEREQHKRDIDAAEDDELIPESPAARAERARQFATIKELLTAAELGTS
jgi:hypothetical protein